MKKGLTWFLRCAVILLGLAALSLCVYVFPSALRSGAGEYTPVLIGLYVPAIPFFFALYETLRLLGFIDKRQAFSQLAVRSLKNIKYCAIIISTLFVVGMPLIFVAADKDDAPGVVAIGLVIIGASLAIATFAAVLQTLLQEALAIKSENDLTV